MDMKLSDKGRALIEHREGRAHTAYWDKNGLANGCGHHGPDVYDGQVVDDAQIDKWLDEDTAAAAAAVNAAVKVPLTQDEFDSLISFAYNVGVGAFEQSTLLRKLNAGDYSGADHEFGRWIFSVGTISAALRARRQDEAKEFSGKENGTA